MENNLVDMASLKAQNDQLQKEIDALQVGGRSGTSHAMDREQVGDMIALANAEIRTDFATLRGTVDTKFAELSGDIKLLSESVRHLSTQISDQAADAKDETRARRNTGIATAVGILAILATLVAGFGPGFIGHHDQSPAIVSSASQPAITNGAAPVISAPAAKP